MTLTYDTNIVSDYLFNRLPRETQIAIEIYHPPRPATLQNINTPQLLEIIISAASAVGFNKENFFIIPQEGTHNNIAGPHRSLENSKYNLALGYHHQTDIEILPKEPYIIWEGTPYLIKNGEELVPCPSELFSLLPYEKVKCSPHQSPIFGLISPQNLTESPKNITYHAKSFVMSDNFTLRPSVSTAFWDILKSRGIEETHLPRLKPSRVFEPATLYHLRQQDHNQE